MAEKKTRTEEDPRIVYADIIDLPHHRSSKHPPMSLHDRAAQFAPYAALVGYDEMVDEEARITDRRIEAGEEDLQRLDRKLAFLSAALDSGERPEITVLHFIPDSRKAGGRYETVKGAVHGIDLYEKKLILSGSGNVRERISIDLDQILDLQGEELDG